MIRVNQCIPSTIAHHRKHDDLRSLGLDVGAAMQVLLRPCLSRSISVWWKVVLSEMKPSEHLVRNTAPVSRLNPWLNNVLREARCRLLK